MSTRLYQIAVQLTMTSNHGTILDLLSRHLLHVHHGLNQATLASNRFRVALVGAATAFMGTRLLEHLGHVVGRGAEFARVMDRMRLAGWSAGDIGHATDRAFSLAQQFPSLPASFIMEMMREMAPVLGSREESQHVASSLAELMRVLEIQRGPGHTEALHAEIIAAVRAGELSANTLTDTRFREFLNLMVPSINAWGGLVTPRDLAQFYQYARQSGVGLSDRFIRDVAPTLIQEMRASGTGTAMMTMQQALIGGRMTLRALNAWDALELVNRDLIRPENLTPEGRIRRLQPGLIREPGLLMSDPDRWAHQVLVPAMIQAGRFSQADYQELVEGNLRTGGGGRARQAIQQELMALFGDRTPQGLMGTLIEQIRKIARDARLVGEALHLSESQDVVSSNFGMAVAGVRGAWQTLNEALALPNTEPATRALNLLSSALGVLTSVVRGIDPSIISSVFVGLAGFVAVFVGLAGFVAVIVGGAAAALAAIVAAFVGWPVVIGAAIALALGTVATYVYQQWGWVRELAGKIGQGLMSLPGMLGDAIAAMVSGIAAKISAALAGIGSWIGSLLPGGGLRPAPVVPGFPQLAPGSPGGLQQQGWVPPPRRGDGLIPVHNVITIDGHRIAEAVSHYIAQAATHVQSAAQFDGAAAHVPVDMQMA